MSKSQLEEQHNQHALIQRLERMAAEIFARHGVDFATTKRAGGWSNATWIAGGLALRLSVRPGNENLHREARLAALLPAAVGYPVKVDSGVTDGYEWVLAREVPGNCLGEAWPELDWDERISAVRQLWEKAQAVHTVSGAAAANIARTRAWFNSNDAEEAQAGLARVAQQGLFTQDQIDVLADGLCRFWQASLAADCVLVHGDLTLDNAMWNQGQVVSLLDFEFALTAPLELDLNTLLKAAIGPEDDPCSLSAADCLGRQRLAQAAVELAQPVVNHPGGRELLFGYAILLDLWLLELWLAHPEGEGPLETWDPYRRLLSLADGKHGYLGKILNE